MNQTAAEVIMHIADKLDVPVQQLWAGLIAYAPFVYYQWITGVSLGILGGLLFTIHAVMGWKKSKDFFGIKFVVPGYCALVIWGVTVTAGIEEMPNALAAKYAPEAWATKHILNKVGK